MDFSLGIDDFYRLWKSGYPIYTGNQDVLYTMIFQSVHDGPPEIGTFIFAYIHSKNIFLSVHINTYSYVDRTLYNDIAVMELVERYIRTKTGVRDSARAGYRTVQRTLEKEPFGEKKISQVKVSDAKLFLIKLQSDGKGYSSIHSIRGVL